MSIGNAAYGVASLLNGILPAESDMDISPYDLDLNPKQCTVYVAGASDEIRNSIVMVQSTYRIPEGAMTVEDINLGAINSAENGFRGYMSAATGKKKGFRKYTRSRYKIYGIRENPDGSFTSLVGLNDWQRYGRQIEKEFGHKKYWKSVDKGFYKNKK